MPNNGSLFIPVDMQLLVYLNIYLFKVLKWQLNLTKVGQAKPVVELI